MVIQRWISSSLNDFEIVSVIHFGSTPESLYNMQPTNLFSETSSRHRINIGYIQLSPNNAAATGEWPISRPIKNRKGKKGRQADSQAILQAIQDLRTWL